MIVKWNRSQLHRFLSNEASSVWLTLLLISAQLQRVVGNKHCQLNRQWELCGRRRNGIPCPLRQHPTRRARRPCVPLLKGSTILDSPRFYEQGAGYCSLCSHVMWASPKACCGQPQPQTWTDIRPRFLTRSHRPVMHQTSHQTYGKYSIGTDVRQLLATLAQFRWGRQTFTPRMLCRAIVQ